MASLRDKCGAKRPNGESCRNPAGYRTPHPGRGPCFKHFGCTPTITDKYILEEAMENALGAGFRGHSVQIGPHEALLEEVRRTAGKIRFYENMLNYADWDELAEHKVEGSPAPSTTLTFNSCEREAFRERQHLVNVCAVAARAGVEERQIRIAEQWGLELSRVMGAIFLDLNLSPAQLEAAPAIVEAHLLLLEAPSQ